MHILQAINKTGQGLEMRPCWWNVYVMDMHGLFEDILWRSGSQTVNHKVR